MLSLFRPWEFTLQTFRCHLYSEKLLYNNKGGFSGIGLKVFRDINYISNLNNLHCSVRLRNRLNFNIELANLFNLEIIRAKI